MLFYPSAITLSNRTLDYVARLIRRHRTSIGSRWRRLPSNRQALLVLAHLRNGDTYQRLASGSVYDLTAARTHNILHTCHAAGLQLIADRGYIGAGDGVHLLTRVRTSPERVTTYPRAIPTLEQQTRS